MKPTSIEHLSVFFLIKSTIYHLPLFLSMNQTTLNSWQASIQHLIISLIYLKIYKYYIVNLIWFRNGALETTRQYSIILFIGKQYEKLYKIFREFRSKNFQQYWIFHWTSSNIVGLNLNPTKYCWNGTTIRISSTYK